MKRLVYKKPDGRIVIVIPSPKFENNIIHVKNRTEAMNPMTKSSEYVATVEHTDLPQDREFRGQWRLVGNRVEVDPTLETEERWKRIRRERNKRLDESDKELLKAQDLKVKVNEWKTYRQALRDITDQADPKNISWPEKP